MQGAWLLEDLREATQTMPLTIYIDFKRSLGERR